MSLRTRLRRAYWAFCDDPDGQWVVIQNVEPLGYRMEFRARNRQAAEAWKIEHIVNDPGEFLVVTRETYREMQIRLLESNVPWVALGALQKMHNALAAEVGIEKAQSFANTAKRGLTPEWLAENLRPRA